jgi:hypothetical protein
MVQLLKIRFKEVCDSSSKQVFDFIQSHKPTCRAKLSVTSSRARTSLNRTSNGKDRWPAAKAWSHLVLPGNPNPSLEYEVSAAAEAADRKYMKSRRCSNQARSRESGAWPILNSQPVLSVL